MIDVQKAIETIKRVLSFIQTSCGHDPPDITLDTRPLRDLEDFDSLMALVATGLLATELDVAIPDDTNIFLEGRRILTIAEAAQRLAAIQNTPGALQ